MKRIRIPALMMLTVVLGWSLVVWAEDPPAGAEKQVSLHKVEALGHTSAPQAGGEIQHNVRGDALHFVYQGSGLVAGQEHILTCCEREVAKGKADAKGVLQLSGTVTDREVLQCIAENPTRRFYVMQGNRRLARSQRAFAFEYKP